MPTPGQPKLQSSLTECLLFLMQFILQSLIWREAGDGSGAAQFSTRPKIWQQWLTVHPTISYHQVWWRHSSLQSQPWFPWFPLQLWAALFLPTTTLGILKKEILLSRRDCNKAVHHFLAMQQLWPLPIKMVLKSASRYKNKKLYPKIKKVPCNNMRIVGNKRVMTQAFRMLPHL